MRAADLLEDEDAPQRRHNPRARGDDREGDGERQRVVRDEPRRLRDRPHQPGDQRGEDRVRVHLGVGA